MLDESAGPGVTPITQKLKPARFAERKNKRKPDLKDCLCAEARLHKYTGTRIHKYTNTQIHKNIISPIQIYTKASRKNKWKLHLKDCLLYSSCNASLPQFFPPEVRSLGSRTKSSRRLYRSCETQSLRVISQRC